MSDKSPDSRALPTPLEAARKALASLEEAQAFITGQQDLLEKLDIALKLDIPQLIWLSRGLRRNPRALTGEIREDLLRILVDMPANVEELGQNWEVQWGEMDALLTAQREELAVIIDGIEKQEKEAKQEKEVK